MLLTEEQALEKLKAGGIVALPTETVYGLAARIDDEAAIRSIFAVKERPFFDPLIVHVASIEEAKKLVTTWSPIAERLADLFWPGPLTMVLPKNSRVSGLITSGLDTVALRVPRHDMTLDLLEELRVPLAAPSANKFGHTSPTLAAHVEQEFSGSVGVLDGGPCDVGVESTVLLIQENQIAILREGMITLSQIESALKGKNLSWSVMPAVPKHLSPGHMKHHYMPSVPLVILKRQPKSQKHLIETVMQEISKLPSSIEDVQILKPTQIEKTLELTLSSDPVQAAREFYQNLRLIAEKKPDLIIFNKPEYIQGENWAALWNRISKAASLILDQELQ